MITVRKVFCFFFLVLPHFSKSPAADDSFVPLDSDAALETAEAEQERLDDEEFERQVLGDPIDNDSFDGQHYRFKVRTK